MAVLGVVELKNIKKRLQENNRPGFAGKDQGGIQPEHRSRRKRGLFRSPRALIIFSLLLLVLIWGSGIMKDFIFKFLINAVPASTSVLEETIETSFILLREEVVVSAPYGGTLEMTAREGERVAKGVVIGYLVGHGGTSLEKEKRTPLVSPAAGILSFRLDGYEYIFKPDTWTQLDIGEFKDEPGLDETGNGEAKKNGDAFTALSGPVEAGQNLFRITDNLQPSLLYVEVKAPLPDALRYNEIEIRLREPVNLPLKGTVHDIYKDGEKYRILVRIPSRMELQNSRLLKGTIITNKYRGVVLEKAALVMRDNVPGVYILHKGQVTWQRVEVIGTVGSKAAVAGLGQNDWIVTAPALVKEGQRIIFYNKYD